VAVPEKNDEYQYRESGLDNLVLVGMSPVRGSDIRIPKVNMLHKLIAEVVVTKPSRLNGKEIRFLRTHIGYTVSDVAGYMGLSETTVKSCENGSGFPDRQAEFVFRGHVLREIDRVDLLDTSWRNVPADPAHIYRIDASNPDHYTLLA